MAASYIVDKGGAVLVMPGRRTSTMELLAGEAAQRGMVVLAAEETGEAVGPAYWYGGPVAGARLAGRLGFALLEPADDWLPRLPEEFTGRKVRAATLADAWAVDRPTFVKPPRDKSFAADVYDDGSRLPTDLDPATPVLLSEVVTFAAEYRLFLLDGRIAAGSRYAVFGGLTPARSTGTGRSQGSSPSSSTICSPGPGPPCPAPSSWTSDSWSTRTVRATGGPWWRPTWRGSPTHTPLSRRACWTWCCGRRGRTRGCSRRIWPSCGTAPLDGPRVAPYRAVRSESGQGGAVSSSREGRAPIAQRIVPVRACPDRRTRPSGRYGATCRPSSERAHGGSRRTAFEASTA